MAFITGLALPTTSNSSLSIKSTPRCEHSKPQSSTQVSTVSRRSLFRFALATIATTAVIPEVVSAKNGTGLERAFSKVLFPKEGFNAPDSVTPSEKIVNKDALKTKEAKEALSTIRSYDSAITDLYNRFQKDPQIELTTSVRNLVSISTLRNALNVVNEAIDEESQVATDKVVRGIIQDIGELETAAILKKGAARTPKKIERTTDWFDKLTGDFSKLLSFYS